MSTIIPGFINGPKGRFFLMLYLPETGVNLRHWVVHVPAFGEEMNKSRHMVSRQARAMAQSGVVVIVPDLYGAGDGACEFDAIDWSAWKTQLVTTVQPKRLPTPVAKVGPGNTKNNKTCTT